MTQPLRVSLSRTVLILCLTAGGALSQTPPAHPPAPAQTPPPADKNAPEMATQEAPAMFKTRVNLVSVQIGRAHV